MDYYRVYEPDGYGYLEEGGICIALFCFIEMAGFSSGTSYFKKRIYEYATDYKYATDYEYATDTDTIQAIEDY